jgi:hypothetical protein
MDVMGVFEEYPLKSGVHGQAAEASEFRFIDW